MGTAISPGLGWVSAGSFGAGALINCFWMMLWLPVMRACLE